jgi:hypothetical protein
MGNTENYASNNSSIVACVFVTVVTFLPSRCLATIRGFSPTRSLATIRGYSARFNQVSASLDFATIIIYRARSSALRSVSAFMPPPPQVTGWPSYTSRHRVPFSSPTTTRRATVVVFQPASTRGNLVSCCRNSNLGGMPERRTAESNPDIPNCKL